MATEELNPLAIARGCVCVVLRALEHPGCRIPHDRGVLVLPDILAHAGGVTVSCFEWVQGLMEYLRSEEEVRERLHKLMHRVFAEVMAVSERERVDKRLAAYILAVSWVAEANRTRGWCP